jgi:hypothetical protein
MWRKWKSNIEIRYRGTVVIMKGGWNQLRIVSSGGLWY